MNKALFIHFYFPPCGSSSTARNIGFPKHLKSLGIEPIILTVREDVYKQLPITRIDNSFDLELKNLNIIRTRTFIPVRFIKLLHKLRLSRFVKIIFPIEPHILWLIPGVTKTLKILKREKVDFIFSSSLPNTTHLIGFIVHKITKVPWIADFQDPMGYRIGDIWITRFVYKFILWLEKIICGNASGLITHSPIAREILIEKYPFIDTDKIISITNAYDTNLNQAKKTWDPDRKFRIVHSGEFYGHYSGSIVKKFRIKEILTVPFKLLEYRNFKSDFSQHSMEPLLRSVSAIIEEDPSLKERLEVILNGYLHPHDRELVELLKLSDIVKSTGLTNYNNSLEIINSADLLYFPLAPDLIRKKNYWIPSKIFPYLASLKPILAPIQEGDAKDVVKQSGLDIFVSPGELNGMAKAIKQVINEFHKGIQSKIPDIIYIKHQSRFEKTRALFDFAQKIVEKSNGEIIK